MKIAVIGAGSFGTAFAQQISFNKELNVEIFGRDIEVIESINNCKINSKYFPNKILNNNIEAKDDFKDLSNAEIIFLCLPSGILFSLAEKIVANINENALLVNMSKGILNDGKTIVDYFRDDLNFENIVSLKGPSFSADVINNEPTMLTLGYTNVEQIQLIRIVFEGTNIFLDLTEDILGVEYLSAIKNIYAIYIGNIDAIYNSSNTRFFIFTKCVNEIKIMLKHLGCSESTFTLSCGVGDFGLTSLNDLSRNRTLGLLIGKGFYSEDKEFNNVVLEGVKTLHFLNDMFNSNIINNLPILKSLIKFFVTKEEKTLSVDFNKLLRRNFKTVLTYGTFDLLHYGHLELLRRCDSIGDRLIVGVSTDEFNLEKGKVCEFSFEKRKQYLEFLDFVDFVIPESNWDQKIEDIKNYKVDYFIMGDDWKGKFDYLNEFCEVIYLPRTEGISTTKLKKILRPN